jgi:hypothetical protein
MSHTNTDSKNQSKQHKHRNKHRSSCRLYDQPSSKYSEQCPDKTSSSNVQKFSCNYPKGTNLGYVEPASSPYAFASVIAVNSSSFGSFDNTTLASTTLMVIPYTPGSLDVSAQIFNFGSCPVLSEIKFFMLLNLPGGTMMLSSNGTLVSPTPFSLNSSGEVNTGVLHKKIKKHGSTESFEFSFRVQPTDEQLKTLENMSLPSQNVSSSDIQINSNTPTISTYGYNSSNLVASTFAVNYVLTLNAVTESRCQYNLKTANLSAVYH